MGNKKKIVNTAPIKKALKDFMADEDGFVSRETMLKVGLSTVAGVGVMGVAGEAMAWHSNSITHTNTMNLSTGTGGADHCLVPEAATHTNARVHCNHSSY